MAITNPENIPLPLRAAVEQLIVNRGPQLIPDKFPKRTDGNYAEVLSNQELAQMFELITRRFWRNQLRSYQAQVAAEAARQQVEGGVAEDPFTATGG